jgi:hypothetical protein
MRCQRAVVLGILLAACWLGGPAAALAQSQPNPCQTGNVHAGVGGGVQLTVDTRRLFGPGYRPVDVKIAPLAPTPASRTLTFVFMVGNQMDHQGSSDCDTRVVESITIPGGALQAQKTILVPGINCTSSYRYQVLDERGVEIRPLAIRWIQDAQSAPQRTDESAPRFLIIRTRPPGVSPPPVNPPVNPFVNPPLGMPGAVAVGANGNVVTQVDPAMPDTSALADSLSQSTAYPPTRIFNGASNLLGSVALKTPPELGTSWLEYTPFDVIVISLDELAALRRQPEKLNALMAWVGSGGNLLVWGVGADWKRLGELESLAGLERKPALDAAARGWQSPSIAYGTPFQMLEEANTESYAYGPFGGRVGIGRSTRKVGKPTVQTVSNPPPPPFRIRYYQLGTIIAYAEDPFPGTTGQGKNANQQKMEWDRLLGTLGPDRLLWTHRNGMSTLNDNPDFWNFLIPGVGLAPVGTFQILITLFVIGIGPANYFFLRRKKRLHLLIVTVPASAIVVTLFLLGYAIIADGFATRARARSLTVLDQTRGTAACFARLSFYSGLSPSGGLSFPADAAVYPYEAMPGASAQHNREVRWDDGQRFAQGWLPSRTATQFVTVRSRATDARLLVSETPAGVTVVNRLGARIERLYVRTASGCWVAEDVEPGATAACSPIQPASATVELGEELAKSQPTLMSGIDPGALGYNYNSVAFRRRMFAMGYNMPQTPRVDQATCGMEQTMTRIRDSGLGSDGGGPGFPCYAGPRSFVAIVDRSPEVTLGTDRAQEEDSFHLILGNW